MQLLPVVAGLLHDLEKVKGKAKEFSTGELSNADLLSLFPQLFSPELREKITAVFTNYADGNSQDPLALTLKLSKRLASGDQTGVTQTDSPLIALAATIDLGNLLPNHHWGFNLTRLEMNEKAIYPIEGKKIEGSDYALVWDRVQKSLGILPPINTAQNIHTILSILKRELWNVPWNVVYSQGRPDVSLYNHLKLTAAIAACLADLPHQTLQTLASTPVKDSTQPVALLLRADFSGIQDFIYRITNARADGSYKGAGKRLRGRSFYLSILGEVIPDWLLRSFDLTRTNLLFNGGGRFDLLLPLSRQTRLASLVEKVQDWLVKEQYGELSLVIATEMLTVSDFLDMRRAYGAIEENLEFEKLHKWIPAIKRDWNGDEQFFHSPEALYHTCSICRLTPLPDPGICDQCSLHLHLGEKLPSWKTSHVAFVYGYSRSNLTNNGVRIDLSDPFGTCVLLLNDDETAEWMTHLAGTEIRAELFRINEPDFFNPNAPLNIGQSFRFTTNTAPRRDQNVMDFEDIAEQALGANLLGVLKADVDRLGLAFSEGLFTNPSTTGQGAIYPTLARITQLSETIDLFFSGWLNKLLTAQDNSAIYSVYSGGDDLLMVGPWDQIVGFAENLHKEFKKYTCFNENLSLSAGVVLVKPHYPVSRFAQLASDALDEAKASGRNRIHIFGETVEWGSADHQYSGLLNFARNMAQQVEDNNLPSRFIYFLKSLRDQYFAEDYENQMWVPKLFYSMGRRLKPEVIKDLGLAEMTKERMRHIRIPVSYASLIMRKD